MCPLLASGVGVRPVQEPPKPVELPASVVSLPPGQAGLRRPIVVVSETASASAVLLLLLELDELEVVLGDDEARADGADPV